MFDFKTWEPWLPFIVILISLVVLPFVTTTLTRWQEAKRAAADARQTAMTDLITAAANNELASLQRNQVIRRSNATGGLQRHMVEDVYDIDVVGPAAELKAAVSRVISLSKTPDATFTEYLSEISTRQFRKESDWSLNLAIVLGSWVRGGKTDKAVDFIRTTDRSEAEKQPTKHQQEPEPQEPPTSEEQSDQPAPKETAE